MTRDDLSTRTLTDDDFEQLAAVLSGAFLLEDPELWEINRRFLEIDRVHGVFEGTELLGSAAALTRSLTLPGGVSAPVAAVTWVGTALGHRRRGILSRLMTAQLHGLHESGAEPIACLGASEGGIYRRFGYGVSTEWAGVTVPGKAPFRPEVDLGEDRVRETSRAQALPLIAAMYDQGARHTGWMSRAASHWDFALADTQATRSRGGSRLHFALHPEGYAVYRVHPGGTFSAPEYQLHVLELFSTSPVGHAALWRYLLDVDWISEVRYPKCPTTDPLFSLLADRRQAASRPVDALWVRLVDVDRALAARRYSAPLDVVLEVLDPRCPWNDGRLRLRVDEAGAATAAATSEPADLTIGIADLGAVFLGAARLSTLAASGLVSEHRAGAVAEASRAFLTDPVPYCTVDF
ncbi:putative acetyltransferase [Actinoalloteichus hoggarensis]|uniref:Enhanced intracellular survival protein n=1 Tax=Actinoalloteichus hoggarensis TaxID=1470176 RepID=A0A221W041_9PSEU|nr:GNAT family N-acetyltransferase [Actinoalloteichus hoggarensis]ASO19145.1 Enhanced intracellular survival protein [Actinoalloteichus hoggarensis]MBB5920381.1 putative acetyltransferase [Actinoalloteichus hoggarensis]